MDKENGKHSINMCCNHEIILEIFSSGSACLNILYLLTTMTKMMVIFQICDETQSHHISDMICTKTLGIGAVFTYNYYHYHAIILTCIIYIFLTWVIYFNFVIKSLCYVVNHKDQTDMKRVKVKPIGGNESYSVDDNVTVMVQVDVKENFDFSHDFKWHFLRKSLLLLSLLLLCLRATTAVFYDDYDVAALIVFLNICRGSSDIILYMRSESYDESK